MYIDFQQTHLKIGYTSKYIFHPIFHTSFRYNSADDDNFTQPGIFWSKVLNEEERERLVGNIAGHLVNAQQFIQKRAVSVLVDKAKKEWLVRNYTEPVKYA